MEYEPLQCLAALVPFPVDYRAAGTEFISALLVLVLYSTCVVMSSVGDRYSAV